MKRETRSRKQSSLAHRWIYRHYTKLTRNNEVTCNYCNRKFVIDISRLVNLCKHLVEAHPNKLTEDEKKDMKFYWTWDYFTLKSDSNATCTICKKLINCTSVQNLKEHLRNVHK